MLIASFFVQPRCTSLGWCANVNGYIFTATKLGMLQISIAEHLRGFMQTHMMTPLQIRCHGKRDEVWNFDIYRLPPNFYP